MLRFPGRDIVPLREKGLKGEEEPRGKAEEAKEEEARSSKP